MDELDAMEALLADAADDVAAADDVVADAVVDVADMDEMLQLGQGKRRRPRDADLAERARTFKQKRKAEQERDMAQNQLQNARSKVRELQPGVLTTFIPSDICVQGFTRAYKGSRLSDRYHKLQNFMLALLAGGIEFTQNEGLEKQCQRALDFTRAGGSVVLGAELAYDDASQRLSVSTEFAKGKLKRGNHREEQGRIKNVTCPILVRVARTCVEFIPGEESDVEGHEERDVEDPQEFGSLGVEPWMLRPLIVHGKGTRFMLKALSSGWPLHVASEEFQRLWDTYLREGTAVLVDVDNRDDAPNNRSYVDQAAGEAQRFFDEQGCPHRQVRHSHRCDIHQAPTNIL